MKRYDGHQDGELEDRLNALESTRTRRKRGSRRWPLLLAGLLLVVVLGGGLLFYGLASVEDSEVGEPVTVSVEEGDSLAAVSRKLEEAEVVGNATLFTLQARIEGEGTQIKPGDYRLDKGEETGEILATLSAGEEVPTFELTIPEGLTLEQTAEQVSEQSGITAGEFREAAESTDYGYAFLEDPAIDDTEGFLFPKRYEFEERVTARQMVNRSLEQYLLETQHLDFAEAQERLGLTEYELLTVASLIERESPNSEERPLIASVIYNRIREDMPLQIDATIQYALGEPREELSLADLEVDSPYNTYQSRGLPPGPIASPSLDSIEAAIEPAESDFLFYVLDADDEEHTFTEEYEEFVEAKQAADR